jgi:NAD(P)-dependent dehydrogenase (short-subunit alcohol dehydrogenase family)
VSTSWSFAAGRALVTGASRGIGRGAALALAADGIQVTLVARSANELDQVADEIRARGGRAFTAAADVLDPDAIEEIVERARPDLLVTSAGTNRVGALTEVTLEDVRAVFELNVYGTLYACRAFGRAAIADGRAGAVVALSSQMGSVGYPRRVAYCGSKHAVNGIVKALALEWAPHRIRVNAVAPTFVRTPFTEPMLADPEFEREVLARIPLARLGEVSDVTGAICFLLSEQASLVTGHVLAVDGGWTVQ